MRTLHRRHRPRPCATEPQAGQLLRHVFLRGPGPAAALRREVLDVCHEDRSREAQPQEPEETLNDEYEWEFEEKRCRVGGWEMEPPFSPPEHVHAHAANPYPRIPPSFRALFRAFRRFGPSRHLGPYVPAIDLCERKTFGTSGLVSVSAPPGADGVKYGSRQPATAPQTAALPGGGFPRG
ncbi:hypothetical protein DFH11DRAFT_1729622 [Phellopilus nigrolimitatus]|nr:hypothetical protein DFH11DRAFT_1729622 [Phellopilus nigrolimitatus]